MVKTSLEALEIIKNAGTIYVGCASNIYTRYSFEVNIIEKELKEYAPIKGAIEKLKAAKKEFEKYPEDKGVLDALTDAQYDLLDLL